MGSPQIGGGGAGPGRVRLLPILALVIGSMAGASAVIFIKVADMSPLLLASLRQLFAVVLLAPLYFAELKKRKKADLAPKGFVDALRVSAVPGVVLGIHFITWIIGARLTPAGNSTLIVNMVPVAMPFVIFIMDRLVPSRKEILATAIAVVGVIYLTWADVSFSADYFAGDLVCFGSMILFAIYLALGRRNNVDGRLWTYVVPLYATGGIACLAAATLTPGGMAGIDPRNLLMALILALVPTVIGHSVLNWAMTVFRPQVVSIVNLSQFIWASIFAYLFLAEVPAKGFWLTIPLILAGSILALLSPRKR